MRSIVCTEHVLVPASYTDDTVGASWWEGCTIDCPRQWNEPFTSVPSSRKSLRPIQSGAWINSCPRFKGGVFSCPAFAVCYKVPMVRTLENLAWKTCAFACECNWTILLPILEQRVVVVSWSCHSHRLCITQMCTWRFDTIFATYWWSPSTCTARTARRNVRCPREIERVVQDNGPPVVHFCVERQAAVIAAFGVETMGARVVWSEWIAQIFPACPVTRDSVRPPALSKPV